MHISETIPSRLELAPDLISSLVEKLYHLPLDEYLVFNIKLALQEAVVNAIEHGNKKQDGLSVKVDIQANDQCLKIEVTDQGEGFDYKAIPNPTHPENIEKIRGRGLFLIQNVMDAVEFADSGRTIRMIKRLQDVRRVKMQTRSEKVGGVAVVSLEGEINVTNSIALREELAKFIKDDFNKVLVDFAKVVFIDSSGLAALIETFKLLKEKQGQLAICNVNKNVRGIFEITKVHKLIDIYVNREAAFKALKK